MGMPQEQAPVTSIPFVAGKSLNKSHNIAIRIQQTKSLMIKKQSNNKRARLNRKSVGMSQQDGTYTLSRQSSSSSLTGRKNLRPVLKCTSRIKSNSEMNDSSSSSIIRKNEGKIVELKQENRVKPKFNGNGRCSSLTLRHKNANECPMLRQVNKINRKFHVNETDGEIDDNTKQEMRTIQEIWADYMFEVDAKNIVPAKCTCYPLRAIKPLWKKNTSADEKYKTLVNCRNKPSSIYLEAKKVMNDCREVLYRNNEQLSSIADTMSYSEDFLKKPTRSNKMARYMQQINKIQDKLNR